jgi:hypothetical protein
MIQVVWDVTLLLGESSPGWNGEGGRTVLLTVEHVTVSHPRRSDLQICCVRDLVVVRDKLPKDIIHQMYPHAFEHTIVPLKIKIYV